MCVREVFKAGGAMLGMIAAAIGINLFSQILVSPKPLVVAGYNLPSVMEVPKTSDKKEEVLPLSERLPKADISKGESIMKSKCASCHQFKPDGKHAVGPLLYGVLSRLKGAAEGYQYSPAMLEKGGKWDYEALDVYLTNPKAYVPGTKMTFAGLPKAQDRANVIAYLRSLAAKPYPLP